MGTSTLKGIEVYKPDDLLAVWEQMAQQGATELGWEESMDSSRMWFDYESWLELHSNGLVRACVHVIFHNTPVNRHQGKTLRHTMRGSSVATESPAKDMDMAILKLGAARDATQAALDALRVESQAQPERCAHGVPATVSCMQCEVRS